MKIDNVTPLVDVISEVSQVYEEGDVIFSPTDLSIIATHPEYAFLLALRIRDQFFTLFRIHEQRTWRISIQSLQQAMSEGRSSTKMMIRLPGHSITTNSIILTFSSPNRQPLLRELHLFPPQEVEAEIIEYDCYFSISSEDFKRVILDLSLIDDATVFITLTNSQVRFHIAADHEIILTTEDGECEIVGYEGEFVIKSEIRLFPQQFILNVINKKPKILFSRTRIHAVITVPEFNSFAQYMFYFPQMLIELFDD